MIKYFKYLGIAVVILLPTLASKADYISLIQADKCETLIEIFVYEDSVRVILEIGEQDYKWFKNIIPVKYYEEGFAETTRLQSLRAFFSEDFVLEADGRTLFGEVKKIEKIKRILRASLYTGKVDTTSTASPYVVFVEIVYPLGGKPARLAVTPPLKEGTDVTYANIGFVLYHKRIPVNDIRYLGRRETVNLNWEDPWYTNFDNINIRRHHNSSLMSFLYIDPYEVRHEILARVKDLEPWLDFDKGIDDYIEVAEFDSFKNIAANFLKGRNNVLIDGEDIEPIIDRVHFVQARISGIQILETPQRLDYSSAIIGVIFAYPNPGIPQKVTIDWDLWNEKIDRVPNTATDPVGPMPYFLTPDDNVLVWQNFLKQYKLPTISEVSVTNATLKVRFLTIFFLIPLAIIFFKNGKRVTAWEKKTKRITIICLLVAAVSYPLGYTLEIPFLKKQGFSKPEATQLISQLLKNTYRAFDFRDESDIYDKLAISNDGDLLSTVYLQTKKSMVIANQGGAKAKVKDVSILDVKEVDADGEGLLYECKWNVNGTVGHWGHIHQRTNQYHAILNVRSVDGVWKLYGLDMIEEVRL